MLQFVNVSDPVETFTSKGAVPKGSDAFYYNGCLYGARRYAVVILHGLKIV